MCSVAHGHTDRPTRKWIQRTPFHGFRIKDRSNIHDMWLRPLVLNSPVSLCRGRSDAAWCCAGYLYINYEQRPLLDCLSIGYWMSGHLENTDMTKWPPQNQMMKLIILTENISESFSYSERRTQVVHTCILQDVINAFMICRIYLAWSETCIWCSICRDFNTCLLIEESYNFYIEVYVNRKYIFGFKV